MCPSLLVAFLLHLAPIPTESPPALYLIEDIATQGVVKTRALIRISLNRDNKLVKETLLEKDQRFFGHFGGHLIAQGRFVVTRYCGVIDIRDRKVIHDEQHGELLGREDGKVIYRIDEDQPISFDLTTGKTTKLERGTHWELPGAKSPDNTMSVKQGHDGTLRLYRIGNKPLDLGKDFVITQSRYASLAPEIPCLWLDADHILTVQSNRKLVTVTTKGVVEQFVEVKDASNELLSSPTLWTDKAGRIIYSCGNYFIVDTRTRMALPLDRFKLGNEFEASVEVDEEQRHTIFHAGKKIGEWVCFPLGAKTAPGLIALDYATLARDVKNLRYPTGVAIWSSATNEWQSMKLSVELIDWAK